MYFDLRMRETSDQDGRHGGFLRWGKCKSAFSRVSLLKVVSEKKTLATKKFFSEDLFDTSFKDDTRNRLDETLQVCKSE